MNSAEIERLKDCNNSLRLAAVEYRRLITELADALDGPRFDAIYQRELVQRAREATK